MGIDSLRSRLMRGTIHDELGHGTGGHSKNTPLFFKGEMPVFIAAVVAAALGFAVGGGWQAMPFLN